jgi:sugar phosphate isomerase/epimerase
MAADADIRLALQARMGLNVPSGWWPTAPVAKSFEAAGFGWLQVHAPPREVLVDAGLARAHADALRTARETSGLRLVLHGPDDLSAGRADHDRALDGLIDYAARAGAELVVYHGANFRTARDDRGAEGLRRRLVAEERALRRVLGRLGAAGVTLAIENLAPVFPSPPRLCHSPRAVAALVRRLGSPYVGMLFDVGHANIIAGLASTTAAELLEPVAGEVVLFHLHDNLGARRGGEPPPGLDPLRLDLHLAPGAGSAPWPQIAPALLRSAAPLVLEVHPPHRPEPLSLAEVTAGLLLEPAARPVAA